MKLLHIHRKARKLLYTKRGDRATYHKRESGKLGWRVWPQFDALWIRRYDFVLFKLAARCAAGNLQKSQVHVFDFYTDKFGSHRFERKLLPYLAGKQPVEVDRMYANQLREEDKAVAGKPCVYTLII